MGTHPIFESDFDCLTDYKSALNKMAFAAGAKIFKDAGETVSDVEQQLSQALVEVENNAAADLKAPLKELYFKNAREFDVGSGRKAIAIFVPFPQLKSWQKIQQKVVRELEKKFSGKHIVILAQRRILPKPTRKTKNQKQKRPFSRTLTSVHSAILDDLSSLPKLSEREPVSDLTPPDFSRSTSTKPCRLMLNTNWKLSATSTRNSPE